MRKPSRTTREGLQPNSRTNKVSLLRELSSSLAWIAVRTIHCTTKWKLYDKVFFAGARASQWTAEQTKGGSEPRGSLKVGEYQATLDSDIVGAKAANGEKANDEKTQERSRDREMSTGAGQGSEKIRPDILTIREEQIFLSEYFAVTCFVGAPYLSERVGKRVYLKLEAELPTGSFKVRGALWALATSLNKERVEEVIASSTGNHGAAVAYAAKLLGVKARIFLPAGCNPVKRGRIASLGAEIVESGGADLAAAFALAAEYATRAGVYFLNDATDMDLPAGPGTIGCEI